MSQLVLALGLAVLQASLVVPVAWLLKRAFDEAIPQHQTAAMVAIGVAILLLRAGSSVTALLAHRLQLTVSQEFIVRLRRDVLERALQLPRSFYQKHELGSVQRLLGFDTERVDTLLQCLLFQVLPSTLLSLFLAAVLAVLDLRLFLALLVVWPVTWVLNEVYRRRLVKATRQYNRVFCAYGEHGRWLIEALDFVRVHHAEAHERDRMDTHIGAVSAAMAPSSRLAAVYLQWQSLLLTCLSLLVLLLGGGEVAMNRLSLGNLLSFFTVVSLINASLREVAVGLYHVFVGTESLARIQELLALDVREPYSGTRVLQLSGGLELSCVRFAYSSEPLLQDFSLRLQSGEWVALMGPNGCGKSTVLSLLLGFIAPAQGSVSADGVPYAELHIGALRRQLGVVSQEPLLFNGTIAENLTYGDSSLSREQLREALRLAAALQWVESLPDGLDTSVGETGKLLSGGQRQKLAIARALVRRPRFLLFDEPTNHLDLRAIGEIFQNLRELDPRPALLLVTHDEGVVDHVDRVVRLGAPVESACAVAG